MYFEALSPENMTTTITFQGSQWFDLDDNGTAIVDRPETDQMNQNLVDKKQMMADERKKPTDSNGRGSNS